MHNEYEYQSAGCHVRQKANICGMVAGYITPKCWALVRSFALHFASLLPFSGTDEQTKIWKMGAEQINFLFLFVCFPLFLISLFNNFLVTHDDYALYLQINPLGVAVLRCHCVLLRGHFACQLLLVLLIMCVCEPCCALVITVCRSAIM